MITPTLLQIVESALAIVTPTLLQIVESALAIDAHSKLVKATIMAIVEAKRTKRKLNR